MTIIRCVIYKGTKKPDSYLYVEQADEFSRVPAELLDMFGPLEQVMSLELNERKKLARADVREVMFQLQQQGYYLQLPPRAHLARQTQA